MPKVADQFTCHITRSIRIRQFVKFSNIRVEIIPVCSLHFGFCVRRIFCFGCIFSDFSIFRLFCSRDCFGFRLNFCFSRCCFICLEWHIFCHFIIVIVCFDFDEIKHLIGGILTGDGRLVTVDLNVMDGQRNDIAGSRLRKEV